MSRPAFPKPFLKIFKDHSLLQETCKRVANSELFAPPLLVGHKSHENYILEQLLEINMQDYTLILEPYGQNTTPALAVAALYLKEKHPLSFMLMLPSDQWIESASEFKKAVSICYDFIKTQDIIVNLTIQAVEKNLNFGHILCEASPEKNQKIAKVKKFIEKPTERDFSIFKDDSYYWNTGIFLTRPQTLLTEIAQQEREIVDRCQQIVTNANHKGQIIYLHCKNDSLPKEEAIDYTVMMHTKKLYTTHLMCKWSDLGTWSAIAKTLKIDDQGNAATGKVELRDTKNCFAFSNKHLVCLLGVQNIITIVSEDAVLVMAKDQDTQLKKMVEDGQKRHLKEFCDPPEEVRHWGSFKILLKENGFLVKELCILPGKQLSLQSHNHRSELWTILEGNAEITIDGEVKVAHEQESIFVPRQSIHQIKNPSSQILKILEIQYGSKTIESDIIRYDSSPS